MPAIPTDDGVLLHYEDEGAGPPIVLVHGWSMSGLAFAPQRARLSSSHRVVAPDLRGHGRSPCERETPQAIEDHARDLRALFLQLDLSGAMLVGWSMGAQVALEALPALQGRLHALALIAATPRFTRGEGWDHGLPAAAVRALSARLARRPEAALRSFFEGIFAPAELDDGERARIWAALAASPPIDPAAARAGLDALVAADQRPKLAEVRVPTLLVHGDRDAICLPAASAWAQDRIPGARRWVLPGVGHAPQLSRPDPVTDALARFLSEARGR